nr:hypothetical protein [uncultured Mediterranean phage uvMED]
MPNSRTGEDYLDKDKKKKKKESLIDRLKKRKKATEDAIKNM